MDEVVDPCPFCGGPGRIESSELSTLSWPVWEHTDCPLNAAKMYQDRPTALKAANTRTDTARIAALVSEALDEAMRRYPDARPALAWFGAASGLSAGEITQEVRDWANSTLGPQKDTTNE